MPDESKPSSEPLEQDVQDGPPYPKLESPSNEVLGSEQAQAIVEDVKDPIPPVIVDTPAASKQKSKKPMLVLLVILALLLAGGGVYWFVLKKDEPTTDQPTSSEQQEIKRFGVAVGLIEGTAEYSTDKSVTWQKLAAEVDLKEGDSVRTAADGRVVLLLDDGSAVRLSNNSTVELTSLATASVIINNAAGEVYTRVTASTERRFAVDVDEASYTAKGSAYRTTNTEVKKGVEVYHSAVTKDTTEVAEGNAFFTLSTDKEKENKVTAIDLTALKTDTFIKWNSEQDKKEAEFANALGVLVELDKPDPTPPPVAPPTSSNKVGISLSGSVSEYSAVFSWKATGVDTSQGYKLVKSKTSQTPTYPENSAAYIEAGKTSYNLYLGDGKTYYFRICAYRGSSCESYSNTVTITTPVKPKDPVVLGGVTLSLSGTTASWTFGGTAPYGFKLVLDPSPSPTYPSAEKKVFSSGTSSSLPDGLASGTKYYIRVCKYDDGNCVDYSNQLEYTAP